MNLVYHGWWSSLALGRGDQVHLRVQGARLGDHRRARPAADDYQRHYESEVSGHLRSVDGFRGARLLRQDDGHEVMFTSITFFAGLDAIRALPEMTTNMPSWRPRPAGR